jgi:outer membrane protein OmpA-like peptidoglycan-associated protein
VSTALAATAVAAPAAAQSIDATVYKPAAPGSGGFAAEDASVLPAGEVDVGVWLDVARDLLVVRDPDSGEIVDGGRLLASRTTMHVGATFGLPAGFQVAASLPIVTSQRGDAMVGGGELGDLALTATWQAFGGARLGGAVALDAEVPLGDGGFAHDAGPVAGARVVVGGRAGRVAWSLAAGRIWREPQMLGDLIVDDAWAATGGARVEVLDRRMWLVADAYAQLAAGGSGQGDPAEALAGARVRVAGPWVAQAGVGVGLTHGYGAPGLRGVALLAWAPDREPRPTLRQAAYTPPPPPAAEPVPEPVEPATRDHDAILDHDAVGCVDTGCAVPDPTPPELVIERIVLDDRILFDTDRARVKRAGRRALGATLARWQASPDWDRIVLEGHADDRGDDAWNDELARLRAERVRDALIELGAPADRITVVSHGKRRPRADGHSERARQENRRVELVVLRAAP